MQQTTIECDLAAVGPSPLFDGQWALRALVGAWELARSAGIDPRGMGLGALAFDSALRFGGSAVGRVLAVTRMSDGIAVDFEFDGEHSEELYRRYAAPWPPPLSIELSLSGYQRAANGDLVTTWELDQANVPKRLREAMYTTDQNEWDG